MRGLSDPTWRTPIGVPRRDEGHPEKRLDPLLPEDRVEDLRVVDVVEDYGSALRHDPPREAAADGDADAAFDLLLETDGGACDELASLVVEEEDGARVRGEDRPDAR